MMLTLVRGDVNLWDDTSLYRVWKSEKPAKWVVFLKNLEMLGNLEWKLFDSGKCQGKFVTDCWTDWWTHEYDFIFHSNILIFVITVSQA